MLFAPATLNLETGNVKELDRATSGRANLIGGGLRMVRDRPIYGYGSGSYAERYRERERVSSEKVAAASHTIPLTVTAEQGVIGLAAYLALVALSLALLFDGLRRVTTAAPSAATIARAGLAAAYCALILHTLVYAAYLEDPLSWALLAIAAGLRARPLGDEATTEPAPVLAATRVMSARPPRVRADAARARAPAARRARAHDGRAAPGRARRRSPSRSCSCARAWTGSARSSYDDEPAFTLQYRNDLFHSEPPEPGELARLEGRRGRQAVTITVRPLELPAPEGDVAHAFLPIYASSAHRAAGLPTTIASSCAPSTARACTTRPATRCGSGPARPVATRTAAISCSCPTEEERAAACC